LNIKQMYENGVSISEIARRTGRDRKTVRHWLSSNGPPRKIKRSRISGLISLRREISIVSIPLRKIIGFLRVPRPRYPNDRGRDIFGWHTEHLLR